MSEILEIKKVPVVGLGEMDKKTKNKKGITKIVRRPIFNKNKNLEAKHVSLDRHPNSRGKVRVSMNIQMRKNLKMTIKAIQMMTL